MQKLNCYSFQWAREQIGILIWMCTHFLSRWHTGVFVFSNSEENECSQSSAKMYYNMCWIVFRTLASTCQTELRAGMKIVRWRRTQLLSWNGYSETHDEAPIGDALVLEKVTQCFVRLYRYVCCINYHEIHVRFAKIVYVAYMRVCFRLALATNQSLFEQTKRKLTGNLPFSLAKRWKMYFIVDMTNVIGICNFWGFFRLCLFEDG